MNVNVDINGNEINYFLQSVKSVLGYTSRDNIDYVIVSLIMLITGNAGDYPETHWAYLSLDTYWDKFGIYKEYYMRWHNMRRRGHPVLSSRVLK